MALTTAYPPLSFFLFLFLFLIWTRSAMAETTYNVTIPHTSPTIYYDNFSTECPDKDSNGFPVCDNANGFHVAANSSGTMRFNFIGSAIYLYGNADGGMEYTWSLDYGTKTTGKPNGNILIAAENLKLDRYSTHFTLQIDLTQFKSGARFQFNKADVVVGTGMTGAQTFVDSYKPGNDSLRLMTGWVANDTIPGYHYYQANSSLSQSAFLNFQGAAVWVWGFCGPRGLYSSGSYGRVSVDSESNYISTSSGQETVVDHKCLVSWQSGLNVTQQHNVTYSSESTPVLLESFDVLRVVGGTRISTTTSSPTSDSSLNSTIALPAAIVGGVVGGLVALFSVVRIVRRAQLKRLREMRVLAAVHGHAPAYAPAQIQPQPAAYSPPVSIPYPVPAPYPVSAPYPVAVPYPVPTPSPAPKPYPVPASHPFNYYSAPLTASEPPIQQSHDDWTAGDVNRLRQTDATMPVVHGQQQHRPNDPIHDDDMPPPEYQLTAPESSGSWQPPPGPSPDAPPATPQVTPQGKKGS